MEVLVFIAVLFLAFSNGANDTFKGVATIYGCKDAGFKASLLWAAGTTLLGAIFSLAISGQMIAAFSGKGLLGPEALVNPQLALAVALGAAVTVFVATRIGMPISTTHGLMGALIGGGLASATLSLNWNYLLLKFVLPLLLAPAVSFAIAVAVLGGVALFRKKFKGQEVCVCVTPGELQITPSGAAAMTSLPSIQVGTKQDCAVHEPSVMISVTSLRFRKTLHFLSGGAVGFARGLNDTPKMAALLLLSGFATSSMAIYSVAAVMTIGGLLGARKIAETMSNNVTKMDQSQGFQSNAVTGLLVVGASLMGSPVSTTHVSCGTIFGIGATSGEGQWNVVKKIVLSWIFTLPAAAALTFGFALLLRAL